MLHAYAWLLILAVTQTPPAPDAPTKPDATTTEWNAGPAAGLELHANWALRAIACMRLERTADPAAIGILRTLSRDADPRVRAFAVAARGLRGDPPTADVILADADRRVLRAALRTGLRPEPGDIAPIVMPLLRPSEPEVCLLAIEIAACVEDPRLRARAIDALGRVIMRFDRTAAGACTPRLEPLLDAHGGYRPSDWQRFWQDSNPRTRTIACPALSTEHAIARASDAAFASFASDLRTVIGTPVDLAICMDSSASMFADLPRAQALADVMARSLQDLVPGSRVGIVGYRDRKSEFITRAFPFDASPTAWRSALWGFAADKGGSAPEAVLEGLRATYDELKWDSARRNIAVLIGDGPPHTGKRGLCADAARGARENIGVTTLVLSALPDGVVRDVEGFSEIAAAGGGQHMRLSAAEDMPSLMLGPAFGDMHRALMAAFRERCDLLIR